MLPPHGYTFIGLNIVRILSIIALLLVFSSSIVVIVHDIDAVNQFTVAKGNDASSEPLNCTLVSDGYIFDSTVPNQPAGAFWAVVNRLLIIGQTVVLLLSEIGFPSQFFDKVFPVLGKNFGLGALGLIQCLIGAAILSHHVDDFSLVSAFFLFSIGCLNIFIGLIWRESARGKRSLTSWRESKEDILPKNLHLRSGPVMSSARGWTPSLPSYHSSSKSMDEKVGYFDTEAATNRVGYGFGRQGEKAAANRGFLITKPLESLPRYVPKQTSHPTGESKGSKQLNPFSPV